MNVLKPSSLYRAIAVLAIALVAMLSFFPPESLLLRIVSFLLAGSLVAWILFSWNSTRRRLYTTLSSIGDAVLTADSAGRVTFLNSVAETLTGWPQREAAGRPAAEVLQLVDESNHERVDDPVARTLAERVMVAAQDRTALVSRSGAETPVEYSAAPVRDESGAVLGVVLVFRDIYKRRQSEERAVHAQKMEAVGRLAGGVAGDFNNVLTVITGYAELLRAEIPTSNAMRRFVEEIIYAGERA